MADSVRGDAGFSLLEVMTSLFIVALIATSGATILLRVADSRESLQRLTTSTAELHRVHALMREDFAQWVPRDFRPRPELDQPTRFAGGDSLEFGHLFSFVRDGWTNPQLEADRSTLIVVRYLVEDGVLIRRVRLAVDGVIGTETLDMPLLSGIEDYAVEFRDGIYWAEQWLGRAGQTLGAPPAVRMSFTLKGGRSYEWLFLTPAQTVPS